MDTSYWHKQTPTTPLFADLEWSRPERRDQAGKLAIIGGNKLSFVAVAESFQTAIDAGVGEAKVLLPNALKTSVPPSLTDVIFAASNPSGSLAKDALTDMKTIGAWADMALLVGDAGRNSETAVVYEQFLLHYDKPLVITRDAVDLVKHGMAQLVDRPDTLFVVSFAQLQKMLQLVYYPKMLTFSMQLAQLVDVVHKFTITYPCSLMVLHKDTMIIASEGAVVTQEWSNPMAIWRGQVATRAASYWLWNPGRVLQASCGSLAHQPQI